MWYGADSNISHSDAQEMYLFSFYYLFLYAFEKAKIPGFHEDFTAEIYLSIL